VVGGQVGGGGHKFPLSLAIQVGGCELPPTRVSSKGGVVVGGRVGGGGHKSPPSLMIQVGGCELPPTRVSSEGGVVVGGQVGGGGHKSPLYSNREWRGGCWQGNPPTRVSSKGGGGHKSPPSLKSRVGEVVLGRNPANSRYEQGRGWACAGYV